MRMIDADALKEHKFVDTDDNYRIGWNDALDAVANCEPTVDAVPVVRCKDCKFSKAYYHGSESNLGMFTYLCTQGLYGMNADDYCSRAERKGDDYETNR